MANVTTTLDDNNLGQVLDGLRVRAKAWEQAAEWMSRHENGKSAGDDFDQFVIEECNSACEAERIAQDYRRIIAAIREQRKAQSYGEALGGGLSKALM